MHARLTFSAIALMAILSTTSFTPHTSAQDVAKASVCESCASEPSCAGCADCGCHGGGLLSNLKGRLACCCCGHFPIPCLASGNMPQRQQYHNGPNGMYYFRPYNYMTITRQQGEATWAKRPGLPYSNDVFKNVYAQVEAGGGQPVFMAPQPELIDAPVKDVPAPAVGTGAVNPGKAPLPLPVTPVPSQATPDQPSPVSPAPGSPMPRPITPPPVSPLLPGPPTP